MELNVVALQINQRIQDLKKDLSALNTSVDNKNTKSFREKIDFILSNIDINQKLLMHLEAKVKKTKYH